MNKQKREAIEEKKDKWKREHKPEAKWVTVVSLFLFAIMIIFCIYGAASGIFESEESFYAYLAGLGFVAPFVFTLIQAGQVLLPPLPGPICCVAGILCFGPVGGFICSYIGTCIGSIAAFYLARRLGQGFVRRVTSPKVYDKYIGWLEKGDKFTIFFLIAVAVPMAPDDFLCYVAGLTRMSLKKAILIILLFKPPTLILYSLVTSGILERFF